MPVIGARRLGALLVMVALAGCADGTDSEFQGDASPTASAPPAPTATATPSATPTSTPSPTATPTPPATGVVLSLGDSVTFGVGVPDPASDAFPALVADRLGAEARVLAVPGETATGFLERRADDVEAAIAALGERLELVTVGLGANEILQIRRDAACLEDRGSPECQEIVAEAVESAAAALDAMVARTLDALEAAGSEAPVILLAYYNPDVEPVAAATIVGADGVVACNPDDPAPGLNDRIACIAERRGTLLVDLYAAFLGREEELTGIGRGDVHPTLAGHAVIADAIVEAVEAQP